MGCILVSLWERADRKAEMLKELTDETGRPTLRPATKLSLCSNQLASWSSWCRNNGPLGPHLLHKCRWRGKWGDRRSPVSYWWVQENSWLWSQHNTHAGVVRGLDDHTSPLGVQFIFIIYAYFLLNFISILHCSSEISSERQYENWQDCVFLQTGSRPSLDHNSCEH